MRQSRDRLPGVPAHQGKLGLTYQFTDAWTISGVLIAQSSQYLFGDEANLTPPLPGFVTLNLSTSYQLTPHIQLFASVENVTDEKYYTFGTFSPTTSVFLAQARNATNPRAYSPAAPVGGFGGCVSRSDQQRPCSGAVARGDLLFRRPLLARRLSYPCNKMEP